MPESVRTPALEERGDRLQSSATVDDTSDQREPRAGGPTLAEAPLLINVIGDGALISGVESLVCVVVTDAVVRPVVADVAITGGVEATRATKASGVAELRVMPSGTTLALEVAATDGAGRAHARS